MSPDKPILPRIYTPATIEKMRKEWSSKELASAIDMRVRDIESLGDMTFLEMGLCILEFERNAKELWNELGYASFGAWMSSGRKKGSRSKRYAALAAVKAMIEIDIPLEQAEKLPRGTMQVLSSVPKQHRKKFLEAAPEMEVEELREKIAAECPEAHISATSPMRFKPEIEERKTITVAIQAAMFLYGQSSREEALSKVCMDWLEDHKAEIEKCYAESASAD